MIKNFKYIIFSVLIMFVLPFNVLAKQDQTITTNFSSYSFADVGSSKTLKVQTSSNLNVYFSSSDNNVASVTQDGVITSRNPGTAIIEVSQSGNDDYNFASKKIKITVPKIKTREEALQPWFDAMVTQQKWSWNATYDWVGGGPTIEKSKNKGTCITMPAVSLQRLGLLNPREYIAELQ